MASLNFDTELEQMKGILYSFAFKLTKNNEDSKDLYQETAFRALVNKDKFREGTNMKAWLFTIMRNIFINDYRKKSKQNTMLDSTDNNFYINSGNKTVINESVVITILSEHNPSLIPWKSQKVQLVVECSEDVDYEVVEDINFNSSKNVLEYLRTLVRDC